MSKKLISFCIPCYRSEQTLEGVIREIEETMKKMASYSYEIILVNDGSPDNTWGKIRITDMLDASPYLLRPANFSKRVPGRGWGVYDGPQGLRIGVVNLIGRVSMDPNPDNPFTVADQVLAEMKADVILVDFHAEATSEKLAMGWYLDGRASAVWGTHTHVPTADGQILPKGTGYITDLGMTGPARSILGIRPELSINKFLGGLPRRYEAAEGPCKLEAAVFTVDTKEKRCLAVRQLLL